MTPLSQAQDVLKEYNDKLPTSLTESSILFGKALGLLIAWTNEKHCRLEEKIFLDKLIAKKAYKEYRLNLILINEDRINKLTSAIDLLNKNGVKI